MTERLPLLTPDPQRSVRTLERCRERIAPPAGMPILEGAFAGLCVAYLAAMAMDIARILNR